MDHMYMEVFVHVRVRVFVPLLSGLVCLTICSLHTSSCAQGFWFIRVLTNDLKHAA